MGLPSLNVTFKTIANTAIERGTRGIVALLLKDAVPATNPIVMSSVDDIPNTLTTANKEQLTLAFLGYKYPPKKVIAYIVADDITDYAIAQHYLETIQWNYFAFPDIADAEVGTFATWAKGLRTTKDIDVKAVLPNNAGDSETIINFVATTLKNGIETYTGKQYCSRIAGLLAGTPLNISATYAPLPELDDCDHMTKSEFDTAINAGKFVLINDGRQVKVARAVNSLVTTTEDKGAVFKKIKVVDIMDQIHDDIKMTIEDNYVGKVQNDYDHKLLLVSAISDYFGELETEGLLDKGKSSVSIDIVAQTAYLKSKGIDTNTMTAQEIKEANTDDQVFIMASIKILDAMENITFNIAI